MNDQRLTWKQSIDGYTDVGLREGVTVGDAICKLADLEEKAAGVNCVNAPQGWISVAEGLPDEHDSIMSKLVSPKNWMPGIIRKLSDTVIACVERKDGRRRTIAICTVDGKWDWHKLQDDETVTHWMPLPEPPKQGQ